MVNKGIKTKNNFYSKDERIQCINQLIEKIKLFSINYSLNRLEEYRPIVELYAIMHEFIETGHSVSGCVKFTDEEWKGGCKIHYIFNNNKKFVPNLYFTF